MRVTIHVSSTAYSYGFMGPYIIIMFIEIILAMAALLMMILNPGFS